MTVKKFEDWKIISKILSLIVLTVLPFLLIFFLYTIPSLREKLYTDKKDNVRQTVEVAYNVFEQFNSKYENGEISLIEAQYQAKSAVKEMRYNKDDYFWINDTEPNMVMHPFKPELDGKSLKQNKDPHGKYLFVEMVKVCRKDGDGFVDYMWPKPGSTDPEPKISYVKLYKDWGWIIGSGIYVDDVEAEISSIGFKMLIFLIIGTIITLTIAYFVAVKISVPIKKLEDGATKLALGDSNVVLDYNAENEIGSLTNAFNKMVEKITRQLKDYDGLPSPVVMMDNDFTISYINQAGANVLGKDQKSLIGQKCYDNFKTDHCKTENCACFKAMKSGQIETERTTARPQGDDIPIMYSGAPRKDKEGNIIGAIEFVTDLSDSKAQENYLERSINKMLTEMEKLASGDLTTKLIPEKDNDNISKLFNGYNKSVERIRNMMLEVGEVVSATASASSQISSSSEEMAAGAQEQSAQTSEVASSVEEMTRTIMETTQNTTLAAQKSKEAGEVAFAGGKVVEETVAGMNRIAEVVKESADIVRELGNSSNQIGEIIQVIDDIADQTNLLALNAAIEAARAGEQGRGFAVVADEVRKLAERTTKATKEIADMIKKIQKDTGGAVQSIEMGTTEVEKGKELANKAGESLNAIINGTNEVVDVVTRVAAASEEQSATSEQISKSIESINTVTNESSNGIQQIARASEDLNQLTENLQKLISQFKIDNTAHGIKSSPQYHSEKLLN